MPRAVNDLFNRMVHACCVPSSCCTCCCLQVNLVLTTPEATLDEVTMLLEGPPSIEGLPVVDSAKRVGWWGFWLEDRGVLLLHGRCLCASAQVSSTMGSSTALAAACPSSDTSGQAALSVFIGLASPLAPAAGGRGVPQGPEEGRLPRPGVCRVQPSMTYPVQRRRCSCAVLPAIAACNSTGCGKACGRKEPQLCRAALLCCAGRDVHAASRTQGLQHCGRCRHGAHSPASFVGTVADCLSAGAERLAWVIFVHALIPTIQLIPSKPCFDWPCASNTDGGTCTLPDASFMPRCLAATPVCVNCVPACRP